jgi:hypothetical protein
VTVVLIAAAGWITEAAAGDLDEFRVKRRGPFVFANPPVVTRQGDRTEIRFATRAFSDVTVAIEQEGGRIVRHLASGVLGPNAPAPFQKNSKRQVVVWDGKDDAGRYVERVGGLCVRVSVGLKPRFERALFWSPRKRVGHNAPLLVAAPEGVYVFEGKGVDHLRLFDHEGNYLRTVYPFPADKLEEVLGLDRRRFPQDGKVLPVKHGFQQASLLSSGTSGMDNAEKHTGGVGALGMAVHGRRIALSYDRLNRLATDGSSGGLPLGGPRTGYTISWQRHAYSEGRDTTVGPASVAFSPDGKRLYMTGYLWTQYYPRYAGSLHGVTRLDYDDDGRMAVFVGRMTEKGWGAGNDRFKVPTSVAVDAEGRVYVSDFMNDRVQVFNPEGGYLKTVRTPKPAKVMIHRRTGELWVFSYPVAGVANELVRAADYNPRHHAPTLTHFGPFERPVRRAVYELPIGALARGGMFAIGHALQVELDSWAARPTIWVAGRRAAPTEAEASYWGIRSHERAYTDAWIAGGIRILQLSDGKWVQKLNFAEEVKKKLLRVKPPDFSRQRLYVHPPSGRLYVGEDLGYGKSFKELVEIDPQTGRIRLVQLPFDSEDLAFGLDGLAYLRTDTLVVRYDPRTWREVPWDYGEEHPQVGFSTLGGGRRTHVASGVPTPGRRPVCWHQGGMAVSPTGRLVVACCSRATPRDRRQSWKDRYSKVGGKPYSPTIHPGRKRWGELHVFDRHGRLLIADAFPGLGILHGVGIDREGDLYVMAAANRILDGKPYFNEMAGTLIRIAPGQAKVISTSKRAAVWLPDDARPDRRLEIVNAKLGRAWVQGAKWFYGGVGYTGFNTARVGGGCDCWNSRFALDEFARSFAPEIDHYSVAVLDSNGNLITRVGQYGNADSAGPESAVPLAGDGVGLFHAAFVASHTDRRLFIADAGNGRIVSVKLDYHASRTVRLGGVSNRGEKARQGR